MGLIMDQKGFTLIELMVSVAIIGILVLIATLLYQDYTKRTYIAEGLALTGPLKAQAMEYFSVHGKTLSNSAERLCLEEIANGGGFPSGWGGNNILCPNSPAGTYKRYQGQGTYGITTNPTFYYNPVDKDGNLLDWDYNQSDVIVVFYNQKVDSTFTPPWTVFGSRINLNGAHVSIGATYKEGSSYWRCIGKGNKIKLEWLPPNCREEILNNPYFNYNDDNPAENPF